MDMKVNDLNKITHVTESQKGVQGDGSFKFTLSSAITDAQLQAKVESLMTDITFQGERIARHMDIRDLKRYRGLIKEFLNEVVYRSHKFSREKTYQSSNPYKIFAFLRVKSRIASGVVFLTSAITCAVKGI